MSSRIFQSVIIQMKEATDRCIGVIDDQGFVVACSELSMIGSALRIFIPWSGDHGNGYRVRRAHVQAYWLQRWEI